MSKNSEKIEKEIIRMLQLSSFRNSPKTKTNESKILEKKLIKEDFIEDLNDAFNSDQNFGDLNTDGPKTILTPEMKVAMLANNISQYQATLLDLYKDYNPEKYNKWTSGAKTQPNDNDTLVNKDKTLKLRGTEDDLRRMQQSQKSNLTHTKGKNYDREIKDFDKKVNLPATFLDNTENTSGLSQKEIGHLQKWFFHKDISLISYDAKLRKLTDLGKAQLEFLARAYTGKPLDSFETKLFSIFEHDKEGNHFAAVSENIIREFYTKVMIPYIMNLTKRAKYNPNDAQLNMFIEKGVDHALDSLKSNFDPTRGSLGSFMITAVKNDVINQLKSISDYKLDTSYVYDYLSSIPGPVVFKSIAKPEEVEGHYNKVQNAGKTSAGNQIFGYVYNNPEDAIQDLNVDARSTGSKPSPLSLRFIYGNSKSTLYKSYPPGTFEDVKQGLNYQDENPYESQAIFKVETLPQVAKQTIYEILQQIADVIITDVGKHSKQFDQDYNADYGYVSKNIVPLLKSNKQTFIELMYDLLTFGDMVQVYTKTWVMQNKKGGITRRQPGDPIVYEKDAEGNETPVKNTEGELPNENNSTMVWSSGSLSEEEVKTNFLQKFLARVQEKQGADSTERELIQIFQSNPKEGTATITAVRNGLRKFFGFEGLNEPTLRKNRNKLSQLITNYYNSMLAENKARKIIKNLLLNYVNNK